MEMYALLRFIAGVGLAGELGAGITLVSEGLPKEKRGFGTTIVATVGVTGAIFAALIAELFHWRTCYFIGGGLGLMLLLLRWRPNLPARYNFVPSCVRVWQSVIRHFLRRCLDAILRPSVHGLHLSHEWE